MSSPPYNKTASRTGFARSSRLSTEPSPLHTLASVTVFDARPSQSRSICFPQKCAGYSVPFTFRYSIRFLPSEAERKAYAEAV